MRNVPFKPLLMFILVLFWVMPLRAEVKYSIASDKSEVKYYMLHPAHSWDATSKKATGEIRVADDQSTANIDVTIPVLSFDSGNGNRDSNMGDVVESYIFPNVSFASTHVAIADSGNGNALWHVEGNLTFHGETHKITCPVTVSMGADHLTALGEFEIKPTDYQIELPSLLLVKCKDWLKLTFTVVAAKK